MIKHNFKELKQKLDERIKQKTDKFLKKNKK